MDTEHGLDLINEYLSPASPIRAPEHLRGRDPELASLERELRHFGGIPFVYGDRGVGKTSLARTAAQQVTKANREHVYQACSPNAQLISVLQEVCYDLLQIATSLCDPHTIKTKTTVTLSANPSVVWSVEKEQPELPVFDHVNTALRVIILLDQLVPNSEKTVIILDELEEMDPNCQADLAYFAKQIGDREIGFRFVFVGIADNVQELIGNHRSIPRYITEVSLEPLSPQVLQDIIMEPANQLNVDVASDVLYRITIIANGYPHFAHLIGKMLLVEAIDNDVMEITDDIYRSAVAAAVKQSQKGLQAVYDAAVQRGSDLYKHLVWTLADSNTVDVRRDYWLEHYHELAKRLRWAIVDDKNARNAMTRLGQDEYGAIITNTPVKYGSRKSRYRYKRFADSLMRGYVRLRAESEGVLLGGSRAL